MDFQKIEASVNEAMEFAKAVNTCISSITIKSSYMIIEFVNKSCSNWIITLGGAK